MSRAKPSASRTSTRVKVTPTTLRVNATRAIRAKAPLRLAFAGGGTDLSPYAEKQGGAVLNATIDKYAHVSLDLTCRDCIEIDSLDYDLSLRFDIDREMAMDGQLDLVKGVINHFRREYNLKAGFRMSLTNDAPPGSGLGSSSAMAVACVKALAELQRMPLLPGEIAELAWRIERHEVGLAGGKQDQWAAAFGGFNLLEFTADRTVVTPLRLRRDILNELESSLVLGYVGMTRESSQIIERQAAGITSASPRVRGALDHMKGYAYASKDALVQGDIAEFGRLLDAEWKAKKQTAKGITNPLINSVYKAGKKAGAIGGKISGAGGGGFIVFVSDPDVRPRVMQKLFDSGAQVISFSFGEQGAECWRV